MSKSIDFRLTDDQLQAVSECFLQRLKDGLEQEEGEIRCLPTFIPVGARALSGEAYVLDLGGSNLRAAHVDLGSGTVSPPIATKMPWRRGVPFDKARYLDEQARLLAALPQTQVAPLGYCFSYPAASEKDGDARLIHWTKGVVVPRMEGERVGAALLAHLKTHYGREYSQVAVVNDTVTSLLAGMTREPVDVYAGLIVGTGCNLAAVVRQQQIPKLRETLAAPDEWLPVNLESGNFRPPHLTAWDAQLDGASENPGEQLFEKAVSGLYLGRLFALANPHANFDTGSGARGLVELIRTTTDAGLRDCALSIYQRSAQLVAAQVAGLARFYHQQDKARTLRVVAEGSLAWSAVDDELTYQKLLLRSLQKLLQQAALDHLQVEIPRVENANLIGAAVAAVSLRGQNPAAA